VSVPICFFGIFFREGGARLRESGRGKQGDLLVALGIRRGC